jgi:peroxiredoxin Q/BCP
MMPLFRHWRRTALATIVALAGFGASAAELAVGDAAPGFDLQGSDGNRHRLADHRGRMVVLAWFPKAFTGG